MSRIVVHGLMQALLAALVAAAALVLYHQHVVRPALVIGVVDVSEVYRSKEAEFTQLLTRSGNEEDREKALAMARSFAQRLPAALDELPAACRCIVLLKTSLAGAPASVDLTPLLRAKVQSP